MVKTELKIQPQESKQMTSSITSSSCKNKKYKGVRMRRWGSWVSEIRAPNQKTRIWLGSYSTPEAAARAYDAALLCLKGSSASLNFPMTSSSSYIPADDIIMSPKSIQRVASAAAKSYVDKGAATRPPISPPPSSTSSSSSLSVSSPSMSSSPSSQVHDDDDVPLIAASSFVDNATTTTTPPPLSPPPPSSSMFSVSSPSMSSSSPSDQVEHDDDVSLIQSLAAKEQPIPIMEPWYSFDILQSPQYIDQMFDMASFDSPTMIDDFYEEVDICLWSFC